MGFLPESYEVPQSSGKYMKFQVGDNRFRVLGQPIIGNEGWHEDENGKKPIRKRPLESFQVDEVDPETIKHFWAMPVWNYRERRVQVLELTQKTIMKAIATLSKDQDWGDPTEYDLVVSKVGDGLETEYAVTPKPKTPVSGPVAEGWAEMQGTFDLERLYEGGDPFGDQPATSSMTPAARSMRAGMHQAKQPDLSEPTAEDVANV
jgi:hypothetical protein